MLYLTYSMCDLSEVHVLCVISLGVSDSACSTDTAYMLHMLCGFYLM